MKTKKILYLVLLTILVKSGVAQTYTHTITQSGWYRIAKNGPLQKGENGGSRAAARFILRDATSSLHQMVEFLAYVHYAHKPSVVVLNNSYYSSGTPPYLKIRIIKGSTYEGAAIDIYVHTSGTHTNNEAYYLQDNDQTSGWNAIDWQQVSTSSGDNDGVPEGFSAYVFNLKDIVNGFVTDRGRQQSYYNGNFYTSGNILIGKTLQTNASYKLDVNGNIRANKVVVNTTGADYVFDSTYQLLHLDSLKKFISMYHHLPNILSASELQTSGLDIGKMQKLQLQKIEELTLYMIRKDQEIEGLKQRINQLEKMIHQHNH